MGQNKGTRQHAVTLGGGREAACSLGSGRRPPWGFVGGSWRALRFLRQVPSRRALCAARRPTRSPTCRRRREVGAVTWRGCTSAEVPLEYKFGLGKRPREAADAAPPLSAINLEDEAEVNRAVAERFVKLVRLEGVAPSADQRLQTPPWYANGYDMLATFLAGSGSVQRVVAGVLVSALFGALGAVGAPRPSARAATASVAAGLGAVGAWVCTRRGKRVGAPRELARALVSGATHRDGATEDGVAEARPSADGGLVGLPRHVDPEAVDGIARRFGIDPQSEAWRLDTLVGVYERYLRALLDTTSVVRIPEVRQLKELKRAFRLSNADAGDAHFQVAARFKRDNFVYIDNYVLAQGLGTATESGAAAEADPFQQRAREVMRGISKVLFLSARVLDEPAETEEGYRYEMTRLRNVFEVSEDELEARMNEIAVPFYEKAVQSALKQVRAGARLDASRLKAAREALGVNVATAGRINLSAYTAFVKEQLMKHEGERVPKLSAEDRELLQRATVPLQIADDEAVEALKEAAEPIYRKDVERALQSTDSSGGPSQFAQLLVRREELGLPKKVARNVTENCAQERALGIMRECARCLRVQNLAGAVSQLDRLLAYLYRAVLLLDGVDVLAAAASAATPTSREETVFSATVQSLLRPAWNEISDLERTQMYRVQLAKFLEDGSLDDAEERRLRHLRTALSVSEMEAAAAYHRAAGPIYRRAIERTVIDRDEFMPDEQQRNEQVARDLRLPEPVARSVRMELYRERLTTYVGGNRVPSDDESAILRRLQAFLNLPDDEVMELHGRLCAGTYTQSVEEAMGSTGIIPELYRDGLERLQTRLNLSPEKARELFLQVARKRMAKFLQNAIGILQKKQSVRGQDEQRDVGDDPFVRRPGAVLGIETGAVTIELNNLVDFYLRNQIAQGEGDQRTYPVNLRGVFEQRTLVEMYRQYLIQAFAAKSRTEKERLFGNLGPLGSILGLTSEEVNGVHSTIGSVIYKTYASQALQNNRLEEKDYEFLRNVQNMLGMQQEVCNALLKEAREARATALLEAMFARPKVLPDAVTEFRRVCHLLGVDPVRDLQVGEDRRLRMFRTEIDHAIETGALTADHQERLREVQDDLQLSGERVRQVLLSCIQERCESLLVQAAASLRQQNVQLAVRELTSMLRYGRLLPARIPTVSVTDRERQDLYLVYQAHLLADVHGGESPERVRQELALLREMLGFADEEAPIDAST